jgi:hypothetical protein
MNGGAENLLQLASSHVDEILNLDALYEEIRAEQAFVQQRRRNQAEEQGGQTTENPFIFQFPEIAAPRRPSPSQCRR